jgi:hypothetical protein
MNSPVYVFNNPGNLQFNTFLLIFVRSWHMPWSENDEPMDDTWLRVPALRSSNRAGNATYICINSNVEMMAPIVLGEEESVVLKIGRNKPRKPIPTGLTQAVKMDALDVSEWERENQKSWPYKEMFVPELVKQRYAIKHGNMDAPYMNAVPTSRTYNMVRRTAMPTPCRSCGKGRVRVR